MSALYSPGSVSYFRNKNNWKEVTQLWPNAPKADSFMYIPLNESLGIDITSVLIAAFTTKPEDFKNNW